MITDERVSAFIDSLEDGEEASDETASEENVNDGAPE